MQEIPSKLLGKAVEEFTKLPGIGKHTALRLVLNLLHRDKEDVLGFANSLSDLVNNIKYCSICHNISDEDICPICKDNRRDASTVCIVESIKDVMAIEGTRQYFGLYHVLGGLISPIDGVGPNELEIESLAKRVDEGNIKEIILALSTTSEGDTTSFYIARRFASNKDLKISIISRGISLGNELEFTDGLTLGRSIMNRIPFKE